ncbi:MAG: ATP-dependent helicase, partial [Nevskiales bacterium]
GMPKDTFHHLQKVWVSGRQLQISRLGGAPKAERPSPRDDKPERPGKKPHHAGKPRSFEKPKHERKLTHKKRVK